MGVKLQATKDNLVLGAQRVKAIQEVHVGVDEPVSEDIVLWADPSGDSDGEFATKEYVDDAIAMIPGADPEQYYTREEVDAAIQAIELMPGPQGEQGPAGEPGPAGNDGQDGADGYTPVKGVDYFTETEVQQIVEQVVAQFVDAEEVEY